jgi:hypothetical protein
VTRGGPAQGEERHVVLGAFEANQPGHDPAADLLDRVSPDDIAQPADAIVEPDVTPLDQPVGVEADHRTRR